MSKGVFRVLDAASDGGESIASHQQSVYANNRKVMVKDSFVGPSYPQKKGSIVLGGSETVFVEGMPISREGDPISGNSVAAEGSEDVFSG